MAAEIKIDVVIQGFDALSLSLKNTALAFRQFTEELVKIDAMMIVPRNLQEKRREEVVETLVKIPVGRYGRSITR